MPAITFKTILYAIGDWLILGLPETASTKLPSRSQIMVTGTINKLPFESPLEPDGRFGHWLHIDDTLQKNMNLKAGDTVHVTLEPTRDWPEPDTPADLRQAVTHDTEAQATWNSITPMARWEWVRWVRSTGRQETRARRVEVAISKMKSGKRRPCCWNRNSCSEPAVSRNGVLLEPIS